VPHGPGGGGGGGGNMASEYKEDLSSLLVRSMHTCFSFVGVMIVRWGVGG